MTRITNPLRVLDAVDRLEVGPCVIEPDRITAPYRVVRGTTADVTELVFRYGEPVFDPDDPDVRNLASMIAVQPALNYGYANPTEPWQDPVDASGPARNREELTSIMAYWFDRGVSGFRVDMAASLVKNDPGKRETILLWNEISRSYATEGYIRWTAAPSREGSFRASG